MTFAAVTHSDLIDLAIRLRINEGDLCAAVAECMRASVDVEAFNI